MKHLRISIAQINPTVGDLKGNVEKCIQYIKHAKTYKTDLIIFPEYTISGYPPYDLLLNPDFLKDCMVSLMKLAAYTTNSIVIVGCIDVQHNGIYNGTALIVHGKLFHMYHKIHLEKNRIFDESYYFKRGDIQALFSIDGLGTIITMGNEVLRPLPHGTGLIVNLHTHPFMTGSHALKEAAVINKARKHAAYAVYVNMVGAEDGIVFQGRSLIINEHGGITASGAAFEEDLVVADIEYERQRASQYVKIPFTVKHKTPMKNLKTEYSSDPVEDIYSALVTGTRDYIRKNGFHTAVLGLSGGIDSCLVAAVACDALGSKNVVGIFMPSEYTSKESKYDAYLLAKNLNIQVIEVPIDTLFHTYIDALTPYCKDKITGITKENLQPRIRANILMAFSNAFGWLVLTTGNKSEFATGYSTLYGDSAGGFAVLSDVSKTLVYKLAAWKNTKEGYSVIPDRVLTKVPSAELKPDQKDTDTLPPYHILDPILEAYIENNKSLDAIHAAGFNKTLIKKIMHMVDIHEYKRRQSPVGIKVTKQSLVRDRILPVTNRYR